MNDLVNWTQYFLAIGVLIGLLGALGLGAYGVQRGWFLQNLTGLRRMALLDRRMGVVETLTLDPRRRLVIVRTDETEHVLLLGPERETVLASQAAKVMPEPINEEALP